MEDVQYIKDSMIEMLSDTKQLYINHISNFKLPQLSGTDNYDPISEEAYDKQQNNVYQCTYMNESDTDLISIMNMKFAKPKNPLMRILG